MGLIFPMSIGKSPINCQSWVQWGVVRCTSCVVAKEYLRDLGREVGDCRPFDLYSQPGTTLYSVHEGPFFFSFSLEVGIEKRDS
jgi:hypothetical protein